MEAVKAFNSELSSLYEVKPPISKAKMTAITRGAIKAIKFYKHVVQSVEKFILKCKPEYKVPGLYVIDSIVRQSRHQFGAEKDVFAPRFSKNLQQTFVNLFKCPTEDKSKIIRVLNLWQKNQVFAPEDIQPLFDLADPNNPIYQQIQQQSTPVLQTNGSQPQQVVKGSPALQRTPTKANQSTTAEAATPNLNITDPVLQQLQQLQRLLTKGTDPTSRPEVHFDRKLLDFDYGDDEEEVNPSPRPSATAPVATESVASLLTNPEVLRQLQTLQSTLAGAVSGPEAENDRLRKLHEMKMQEDEFDKHLAQTVPNLPFAAECDFKVTQQSSSLIGGLHFIPPPPEEQLRLGFDANLMFAGINNEVEVITLDHDDSHSEDERYSKRKKSRSRSRSRGRDKDRRRRSRSRSGSRSRGRRHRSRSKDRKDKKERESEKDRERKKRGLPVIKSNHLSVCSTTLWVGHLSKLCHQDDLSNTFGEYGDIISIDLIIPRGCAFIVMHRRQDAARCLTKLKNYNLHGRAMTLAWAPGKGVKGKDLKDYWEGDLGVSYIPYNKLKQDMDLDALEDGGMIDEDTMPEWMRKKMEDNNKKNQPVEASPYMLGMGDGSNNHSTIDTSQPPPMPPTTLMQPPMLPLVNPFQMNNRFLGVLPNVPNLTLGVPPPNMAPPPTVPPPMIQGLGLGINSPFQGAPGFMPPNLPQESKPAPPESLMSLAGPPLTMPPGISMNQPPPPLHISMDDNMDVEMEDAIHTDINKPPPSLLSDLPPLGGPFIRDNRRDDSHFSPGKRDNRRDKSGERGRRRSRSRDRLVIFRDRERNDRGGRENNRDRRERDRDFRGGRDRDRRGGDRDRGNRWNSDRREDRFDRRGGRENNYDRSRRDCPERREPDGREKSEREKNLNERLKEMAGIKFDEKVERKTPPRRPSEAKDEDPKEEGLRFEPPPGVGDENPLKPETNSPSETRNPSPVNRSENQIDAGQSQTVMQSDALMDFPEPDFEARRFDERYRDDPSFGRDQFGYEGQRFESEGTFGSQSFDDPYRPDGRFDSEGPRFRGQGPPLFGDENFGPPPDIIMDGPPGYGPPDFGSGFDGPPGGFDGPPDRFIRGRRGRGRGRGRGPDFYLRDDFAPPMMDESFGPPMRDEFGPPIRNDFGPPRDDFGPPREDFAPRGMRMRGRAFFNRGGVRGRGGPPFRDGFNPDFEPPEFYRGGPRGRSFGDVFGRGRARGFRGNRGARGDFFEGRGAPFDEGPPGEEFEGRAGRGRKKSRSRWEGESIDGPPGSEDFAATTGDGGGTPLRDEIDDPGPQLLDFSARESTEQAAVPDSKPPLVETHKEPSATVVSVSEPTETPAETE
ncbi:SR-related and CTD-associated factor 4 isoform X1 [Euwallacea fornicatus]|uniref:SR-related and CTD-associated factor 4 isoform X1 n=1 Tax=Euwallacea fornicatus TaxID=995702 RepID=UPI00338F157A